MQILNDREELQESVRLALKSDVPFIEVVLCVAASLDVRPRIAAFMIHTNSFETIGCVQGDKFVEFLVHLKSKFEAMHPDRITATGQIPTEEFTNFVIRGTWR